MAKIFEVSEKTIYRWIDQKKLPAHRINEQYRFNRTELLEWATSSRIPVSVDILKEEDQGALPGLEDSLRAGGVYYRVFGKDKPAVLSEVVQVMPLPDEVDRGFLLEVLLARESLGSTGIGAGVAIPHVRTPIVMHVTRPIISLCVLENPVEFGAMDCLPVHTLFTIVSPTIRAHLNLLSRIALAMQDVDFKTVIERQGLRDEIYLQARRQDELVAARARKEPAA